MKRRMRRMVRKMIREYRLMCDPYYYPEWLRELEIVDSEGNSHKFPYTNKTKLRGSDGFRLTIKE